MKLTNLFLGAFILFSITQLTSCGGSSSGSGGGSEIDLRLTEIEREFAELTSEYQTMSEEIDALESNLDTISVALQMVHNQLEIPVIQIIRPCENSTEILLRLSTGEIVAYFESGNRRYLSILENGSYRTTDGTNCYFKVIDGDIQ